MSLAGFRCPVGTSSAGRDNSFEHCLSACTYQCMPKAVLQAIVNDHAGNEHRGNMVSPSSLGKCARKIVLERQTDYFQEPKHLYYAVRGSLIHGFLEGSSNLPGVITERRLYKQIVDAQTGQTWTLSGRFDYYDSTTKTLEDYKTINDKGLYIVFKDGFKKDHLWQTNAYRWLMWGGRIDSLEGEQIFWPVDRIRIHYMSMNHVMSTGSTFIHEFSDRDKPFRPWRLETSREKAGFDKAGKPKWRATIELPEVPLLDFAEVEQYVEREGPKLVKAFESAPDDVPGVFDDEERKWECGFCGPKPACKLIEERKAAMKVFATDEPATIPLTFVE